MAHSTDERHAMMQRQAQWNLIVCVFEVGVKLWFVGGSGSVLFRMFHLTIPSGIIDLVPSGIFALIPSGIVG